MTEQAVSELRWRRSSESRDEGPPCDTVTDADDADDADDDCGDPGQEEVGSACTDRCLAVSYIVVSLGLVYMIAGYLSLAFSP